MIIPYIVHYRELAATSKICWNSTVITRAVEDSDDDIALNCSTIITKTVEDDDDDYLSLVTGTFLTEARESDDDDSAFDYEITYSI